MSFFQKVIRHYPDSYAAQLLVLDAYCSNIESRLTSALDSIDVIQLNHKQEMESLQRRMHVLHAQCRMLKKQVKSIERERDEFQEGVDRLLDKVEANDYRAPPCATMHLSFPLEPIKGYPCQDPDLDHPPGPNVLVSMLVDQLAFFKNNYTQLKRSSDARIASLEAQLARRDLELESRRPYTCSPSHAHGSQPEDAPNHFGTRISGMYQCSKFEGTPLNQSPNFSPTFFRENSSKILDETIRRQRLLEIEVALLHEKVDEEKKLLPEVLATKSNHDFRGITGKKKGFVSSVPDGRGTPGCQSSIDAKDAHNDILGFVPLTDDKDDEQLRRCLLLEEECIRLRKSEQELRQRLLLASLEVPELFNHKGSSSGTFAS